MRNPIIGSRVAIKGGGGKRITTPRLQQSMEVNKSERLVQTKIKGGGASRDGK